MATRQALCALVLLVALFVPAPAFAQQARTSSAPEDIKAGRIIAETDCSSCHAIGRTDTSRHPAAPPLRDLSQRYPIASLEEAFAEGVSVGHRDMPEWRFDPDQIRGLLAYLNSIQTLDPRKDKPE